MDETETSDRPDRISRLHARIKELEDAIDPVFRKTDWVKRADEDELPDGHYVGGGLVLGDLRLLRKVARPPPPYETAWLIEKAQSASSPRWWGYEDGELGWTHDHSFVIRYDTKEAAEREADSLGLLDWFVSEHAWVGAARALKEKNDAG